MKIFNVAIAAWIALGTGNCLSQTSSQPSPKSPVLRRLPAFASWTMTFKYKEEETKQPVTAKPQVLPDRVQSISVVKTNKTVWELTTLRSGKKYEKWIFNGTQLQTTVDSSSIFPILPPTAESPEPNYSDYSKSDFPEVNWVSLPTYKGVQNYMGKPAYLFESTKAGSKPTALLAIETQLPLYFFDGDAGRSYVYNPPPSAPLTPPERFLKVLETHKRGLEALKYHPSPP